MEHAGLQVVRDQPGHLTPHVEAVDRVDVQPIQQTDRRFDARLFVVERANPSVDECRGGRLAEIVADGAQHHREQPGAVEIVRSTRARGR